MHAVSDEILQTCINALDDKMNPTSAAETLDMLIRWVSDPMLELTSAQREKLEEALKKHSIS